MSEPVLIREDDEGVVTLTLNDPKTLNALSDRMLAALQDQINQFQVVSLANCKFKDYAHKKTKRVFSSPPKQFNDLAKLRAKWT